MSNAGSSPSKVTIETVRRLAEQPGDVRATEAWLESLGASPHGEVKAALLRLAELQLPLDLLATLLEQLSNFFSARVGVDFGMIQLVMFFSQVRSPLALATLFDRDREALPILLRVLTIDGPLAQIVLADTESFDVLRLVQGKSISRDALLADLRSELDSLEGERRLSAAVARFHSREVLRIGYSLLTGGATSPWVSAQLSQLAEVISSAVLDYQARRTNKNLDRGESGFRMVAIGKADCGAQTMHFESPLELMYLYDVDATNANSLADHAEEADRRARAASISLQGDAASPYELNLSFRPDSATTNLSISARSALRHLEQFGRTWQRLDLLSARPIAGDLPLGQRFLNQLQPWLYRRRLSDADVDGLFFQYRKWRRAEDFALDDLLQGIRILQLTLGGDHANVRSQSPFSAIEPLGAAGAFPTEEARQLASALEELANRRLLVQLGVAEAASPPTRQLLDSARQIIAGGLQKVFGDAAPQAAVSELIMDPLPDSQNVVAAMAPFGFENPLAAGAALSELAQESSPFLSTRNARHFLAKIGPSLVKSISKSPSPDHTLLELSRVVGSLGAKGALWELFLSNPPSMDLCVRLCAYSPYLLNILIASPGFIDELLDSLQLARLPSLGAMESRLDDLCKGAELEQAIHEFKSALHLRIGVRDILGKEDITSTHQSLAQTAETILRRVVSDQYRELCQKHGTPMFESSAGRRECRYALFVSGKVGALEPNYHSEIDFVVIHESDGMTHADSRSRAAVSCAHFFGQLAQRSSRRLTSRGRLGQLYSVNADMRPLGPQGPIAASLEALRRHYFDAPRSWCDLLWLTKTRPAGGDAGLAADVVAIYEQAIAGSTITTAEVQEFSHYRREQCEGASPFNLKRAAGGTQHIELLVQFLQLTFAGAHPRILTPGTIDAIRRLRSENLLSARDATLLEDKYRLLRSIESRLRLMNTQARHDLPANEAELRSLAMFVGVASPEALLDQCTSALAEVDATILSREATLAKELAT